MAGRKKAPQPSGGEELVTVTAVHPFQIGYAGTVVGPGGSVDVPEDVARRWEGAGIAIR